MSIKEYKLGDIIKFETGIDPKNYEKNGNIPWVKLGNTEEYSINYNSCECISSIRKQTAKKGDLILCWSCSAGKSWIINQECFFSTAFYKCNIVDNSLISNKYLHYVFIKNEKKINTLAIGSVLKKANMKILYNFLIKFPLIHIQQSIIDIIEPKEKLFLKYHRLINIEDFDEFKKTWKVLIDIIEPFEKIKHSTCNTIDNLLKIGDLFVNQNENGIVKFLEIADFNIGKTPSTKNDKYWNGDFIWLNSGSLTNNIFCLNKSNKITLKAINDNNMKIGNKDSVVFSIIDPSKNKISFLGDDSYFNQSICNVVCKKSLNGYIFFELRNKINNLAKLATGTAQQSINKSDIKNFLVFYPFNQNTFNLLLLLISVYSKILIYVDKIIKLLIEKYIY